MVGLCESEEETFVYPAAVFISMDVKKTNPNGTPAKRSGDA